MATYKQDGDWREIIGQRIKISQTGQVGVLNCLWVEGEFMVFTLKDDPIEKFFRWKKGFEYELMETER